MKFFQTLDAVASPVLEGVHMIFSSTAAIESPPFRLQL